MPEGYKIVQEGEASILYKGNDVFYNPAQVSITALNQIVNHQSVMHLVGCTVRTGANFADLVQVINRDMSIAVLRYFVKQRQQEAEDGTASRRAKRKGGGGAQGGIRVLEAMAASGLRAIRYAKEVAMMFYLLVHAASMHVAA